MEKKDPPGSRVAADQTKKVPVVREEIRGGKRTRATGVTRVRKTVDEREETVDESVLKEEIQIERIPINRFVEKTLLVRNEDDTMVIPVFEEVLVVETRILLKEEIRVRKVGNVIREPRRVTPGRERTVVEHAETGETGRDRE
jgi:stress response protein YsnF